MDQLCNEIKENWNSTNVDETTMFSSGSLSFLKLSVEWICCTIWIVCYSDIDNKYEPDWLKSLNILLFTTVLLIIFVHVCKSFKAKFESQWLLGAKPGVFINMKIYKKKPFFDSIFRRVNHYQVGLHNKMSKMIYINCLCTFLIVKKWYYFIIYTGCWIEKVQHFFRIK